MSLFIDSINEKFKKCDLIDIHVQELFEKHLHFKDDEIYSIFQRYFYNLDEFNVTNEEVILIEEELKKELDILISISLYYLLLYSNKDVKNEFIEHLEEYIKTYFKNIESENELYYFENLSFLMELVCDYTKIKNDHKIKKDIAKSIYNKIMNTPKECMNSILLASFLMNYESTYNFFNIEDYIKINEKYLDVEPSEGNIYVYLSLYEEYINYLKINNRNKELKKTQYKYSEFVIENTDLIKNKLYILIKARNIILKFKNVSNEEYTKIDNKIDEESKDFVKNLIPYVEIPSDELNKAIKTACSDTFNYYNSLEISDRFSSLFTFLLKNIIKIPSEEDMKDNKVNIIRVFINEDSQIKFSNILNYKDKVHIEFKENALNFMKVYCVIHIRTFSETLKDDVSLKEYLNDLLSDNKVINTNRTKYLSSKLFDFFKGDYINCTFDIILEFEEMLRIYFKYKNLEIKKENGDLIGIVDVFNDKNGSNKHKEALINDFEEDYFNILKYLLIDRYGFDIRNKIGHRYDSSNLYEGYEAIYTVMLILYFIYRGK